MYREIEHIVDDMFISKIVCDTILSLPYTHMTKQEVNKIINTIIITLEHKKDQFVDDMKKILNDDLFDKSLLKETTEPLRLYCREVYT